MNFIFKPRQQGVYFKTAIVSNNGRDLDIKYLKEVTMGMEQGTDSACLGSLSNNINADLVHLMVRPKNYPNSKIIDITLDRHEEVSPRNSSILSAYSMIFSCSPPY